MSLRMGRLVLLWRRIELLQRENIDESYFEHENSRCHSFDIGLSFRCMTAVPACQDVLSSSPSSMKTSNAIPFDDEGSILFLAISYDLQSHEQCCARVRIGVALGWV